MIMPLTSIVAAHGTARPPATVVPVPRAVSTKPDLGRRQGEQRQLGWQGIADLLARHADQAERVGSEVGQGHQCPARRRTRAEAIRAPASRRSSPRIAELVHRQPDEGVVEPAKGAQAADEEGRSRPTRPPRPGPRRTGTSPPLPGGVGQRAPAPRPDVNGEEPHRHQRHLRADPDHAGADAVGVGHRDHCRPGDEQRQHRTDQASQPTVEPLAVTEVPCAALTPRRSRWRIHRRRRRPA